MNIRLPVLLLVAIVVALLSAGQARADSWAPPQRTIYHSPNRAFRLIVTPHIPSHPEDRPYIHEASGPSAPDSAGGELQRRDERGGWLTEWRGPLRNPVMPVSALVADSGRYFVTFDDWGGTGTGPNVVVIYGAVGRAIRAYTLDEIVPLYMVDAFARSVSSLIWQGQGTRIEGGLLRLAIVEPGSEFLTTARGFFVDLDLATGAVGPISEADLARWRLVACERHRRAVAELRSYVEQQRADLTAPMSGDSRAWETYGYQVASRLYWPSIPLVIMLPDPGDGSYAMNLSSFRHFLAASAENSDPAGDRRVFVAAQQDAVVAEAERAAARLRPGGLSRVEMTFVADASHWPRIAAAFAQSGARLWQVDPAIPLPQQAQVLAQLPPERAVDPLCVGGPSPP